MEHAHGSGLCRAPGDAKLFWAIVVALPPTLCPSGEPLSLHAAPAAVLVNALLCYLLAVLLVPLWRREDTHRASDKSPLGREWVRAGAGLAGVTGWVLGVGTRALGGPLSYLEAFAATIVAYRLLDWKVRCVYWPAVVLPGLVVGAYNAWTRGPLPDCLVLWGAACATEGAYLHVRGWLGKAWVQQLPEALLAPGAVPHEPVRAGTGQQAEVVCGAGQPLTAKQVRRLQDLAATGTLRVGALIELEQAFPFAPFATAGAVLAAGFAGNLVPPLVALMGWLTY